MEIMNMKLKMMATLWDNTYRVAIDDGQGKYIGTARVVVNVPLPPEMLPENAPQVEPQLLVLVEDFDFGADKIINFETTLSDLLRENFVMKFLIFSSTIQVPHDVLNQTISQ